MLVAGDVREALDEGRQGALLGVVVDDEVLAGEGQCPLDDHVVERDRLDQGPGVLGVGGELVHAALQHHVEQLGEGLVQMLSRWPRSRSAIPSVPSYTPTSP